MDYERIENEAQKVLDGFGYKGTREVEIVDLAEKYGFIVGEAQFKDNSDGMILVNMRVKEILGYKTKKLILVNKNHDNYFKRFVIAHELGHYFLDGNNDAHDFILAHRDANLHENDEHEREMDFFAACLLMPKEAFQLVRDIAAGLIENYDATSTIVSLLADFFKVPEYS